ncbi:MAG: hypothetical protein JSS67_08970 [Bacteroidetes bacterium]|nr:hypothetical protein [Bacteroidota bacterium]
MAKIFSINNRDAFGKYLLSRGYQKEETSKHPKVLVFDSYRDPYTFPDGRYCTVSWLVLEDRSGNHQYVQFQFVNPELSNSIMNTLINRNYQVLPLKVPKDAKGNMIVQCFKKGSLGIQIYNIVGSDNPQNGPLTQVIFSKITTPNWPNDEVF